jgi:hypothetical protein
MLAAKLLDNHSDVFLAPVAVNCHVFSTFRFVGCVVGREKVSSWNDMSIHIIEKESESASQLEKIKKIAEKVTKPESFLLFFLVVFVS